MKDAEGRITPVSCPAGRDPALALSVELPSRARPDRRRLYARPDRGGGGRSRLFPAPAVAAGAGQEADIEAELPELGTLILEPVARNTAPAIALAALEAQADDLLLVLPSDHLVRAAEGFREAVRRALPAARDGWIVTFGMKAERPETGYGYIERGEALAEGVFAAARFVEKPDSATAEAFLAGGSTMEWRIFLFRAGTMIEALREFAPEVLEAAGNALAGARREGARVLPDAAAFGAAPSVSIDYAVMEKARKVAVVPVSVGWSDIGSWEALHIAAEKDGDGNVVAGPGLALDAKGCLIRSEGPLVAAIGVENLVIVATGDAVLGVPGNRAQEVKDVVETLKAKGLDEWL